MILAFQCWIIANMSKYLETWINSAYVCRYSKKCIVIFQRWIICTYLHVLRFDDSVSAQNPTMVADFCVSIGNYANRYLEFLCICAKKKSTSLLRFCLFAQIIQSWKTLLSKITIRNFCTCTQNFPRLF